MIDTMALDGPNVHFKVYHEDPLIRLCSITNEYILISEH